MIIYHLISTHTHTQRPASITGRGGVAAKRQPKEIDNGDGTVTAHNLKWTFVDRVDLDAFKDAWYKPKLNVGDPNTMSELDYWMLFPCECIDDILKYTNANLRDRRKKVTKGELYKVIGFLYAMTLGVLRQRQDYWSTEGDLFPAPAFGRRFGMGLHRFEEILMALSFVEQGHNDDKWHPARALVELCASKWNDILTPGYKMTVDESMFAWYGRGSALGGMPAVMKIKRKPKGVGCEVKTLADVASGVMINLEINEGKEAMKETRWQRELGAGTATTLRLSEPWHGSGRIDCGDSWFASVKTAIELRRRGLFFTGIVKTAYTKFPLRVLSANCPLERGSTVTGTATEDGIDIIAHGWQDKKVHTFVSTCGTTLIGTPAKKRWYDTDGKVFYKEVQRTKLIEEYYDGASAVDIHNKMVFLWKLSGKLRGGTIASLLPCLVS